jgi:hypothetical protein
MKSIFKVVLPSCWAVVFGASNAWAQSNFNGKAWFLDLHYYAYEESKLMTEKSRLPSLSLGYQNLADLWGGVQPLRLGSTAEVTLGNTKYDGTGTTNTYYSKFLGEAYLSVDQHLYVGLGYRWLTDKLGGRTTSTGHIGYDRRSQYVYVPIGGTLATKAGRLKVQYNRFIRGKQVSYLAETGLYQDVSKVQHAGHGLDLSFTPNSGKSQVFLRYWEVEKSEVVPVYFSSGQLYGQGWEPKNTTLEVGYRKAF